MLQHECLLSLVAKFGFDTTENEPPQIWASLSKFAKIFQDVPKFAKICQNLKEIWTHVCSLAQRMKFTSTVNRKTYSYQARNRRESFLSYLTLILQTSGKSISLPSQRQITRSDLKCAEERTQLPISKNVDPEL